MNIDERIQIERESLEIAVMPSERREHAEKLAMLEKEKFLIDIMKHNCVMEENNISWK